MEHTLDPAMEPTPERRELVSDGDAEVEVERFSGSPQEGTMALILGTRVRRDDGSWTRPIRLSGKSLVVGVDSLGGNSWQGWIKYDEEASPAEPVFSTSVPRLCTVQAILIKAGIEYL